jgi:hypothetical protein
MLTVVPSLDQLNTGFRSRQSRKFVRGYIAVRVAWRWLLFLGERVLIPKQTRKEISLDAK